jgi:hypothetical protein
MESKLVMVLKVLLSGDRLGLPIGCGGRIDVKGM